MESYFLFRKRRAIRFRTFLHLHDTRVKPQDFPKSTSEASARSPEIECYPRSNICIHIAHVEHCSHAPRHAVRSELLVSALTLEIPPGEYPEVRNREAKHLKAYEQVVNQGSLVRGFLNARPILSPIPLDTACALNSVTGAIRQVGSERAKHAPDPAHLQEERKQDGLPKSEENDEPAKKGRPSIFKEQVVSKRDSRNATSSKRNGPLSLYAQKLGRQLKFLQFLVHHSRLLQKESSIDDRRPNTAFAFQNNHEEWERTSSVRHQIAHV